MSKEYEHLLSLLGVSTHQEAAAEIGRLHALAQPAQGEAVASRLSVWYGSMPESNGKSNWTAILCLDDDMTRGFTIARSEYPDRVRYEADRVRYLIGEIPEEPFILDYDEKKHSGYVSATPATVLLSEHEKVKAELADLRDEILKTYNTFTNVADYETAIARMLPLHKEVTATFNLLESRIRRLESRLAQYEGAEVVGHEYFSDGLEMWIPVSAPGLVALKKDFPEVRVRALIPKPDVEV